MAESREHLLRRLIAEIFVTRQKRSAADLVLAVKSQCLKAGLDPPSESTIRRRLRNLSLAELRQRGELHPETKPVYGSTPISDTPLDWLQMDHTPVDLIIVDPMDRLNAWHNPCPATTENRAYADDISGSCPCCRL